MALPLTIQDAKGGAAGAAAPLLPFSCMTGISKDVLRHIQQGALSAKAKYFLTMIAISSFGNAGWQKQQRLPEPGLWCPFELSAWAREHGWSRQYTWRIREQVEALGILRYEPAPNDARKGTLHWNLNFTEWKALDDTYRRQRYARPRPGQANAEAANQGAQQGSNGRHPSNRRQEASPGREGGLSNGLPTSPNGLQGRSKRRQHVVKGVTSNDAETPPHQTPPTSLRKEEREETMTETTTVVSDAPGASSPLEGRQPTAKEPPMVSVVTRPGRDSAEAGASPSWPPRQAWEKTDLDYYQRVLRERDKERVALLTRLAHDRIGLPLETASYARIGALAKQCGAALLVKHILLAAASHIDGDPLDYLTKLARGQQRKETPHATRSPAPTSAYQPYSAEEASTLVWNTL